MREKLKKRKKRNVKKKKKGGGRTGTVGLLSKRRLPSLTKEKAREGYQLKCGVGRCSSSISQHASSARTTALQLRRFNTMHQ